MAKIIGQKIEVIENVKLIGKKYGPSNYGFADKWGLWFDNNWFSNIENLKCSFKMDNGYIGLLVWNNKNPGDYEYWIGVFVDVDTKCVEGYECLNIPNSQMSVYYIKGIDGPKLYDKESECFNLLMKSNYKLLIDNDKCYAFERYNCPRFTQSDDNGEVILDYAILIK